MSEKAKSIIKRLANVVPQLNEEKQYYILGLTEGMVLTRENQEEKKELQEV